MTRIAGIADLHIEARHLTTLEDQEQALARVADELVERTVELLLIGGDLFHGDRPSAAAIAVAGRFFRRLHGAGIYVVCARGNHDPRASEIVSFFEGAIEVPASPYVLRHAVGVDVAVFPWLIDQHVRAAAGGALTKEELARQLTFAAQNILAGFRVQRRPGVPMVLVGHMTVAGSETATGWSMGFVPTTHWVVPLEDLVDFDVVIAGHIHRRQLPAPNVIVPGSLLPLDFSETEEKGITVVELWPSPAVMPDIEFVPVPTPEVRTYIGEGVGFAKALVNVHLNPNGMIASTLAAGSLVRVQIKVDEATAREYPPARIERALLDAGARKVQVDLDVLREDRARDAEMTTELLPLTALGRYLDGRHDLEGPARMGVEAAAADVAGEVLADRDVAGVGELDVTRLEAHDLIGLEHVDLDLEQLRLAVLQGPVGSGKSAVGSDLLRAALYGATRYGARPTEAVIRAGCDRGHAAVELRTVDGRAYRIVRQFKRQARGGVATQLDVLEEAVHAS